MIVKRVCFGSDCFRPFGRISGVIGSAAFATAASPGTSSQPCSSQKHWANTPTHMNTPINPYKKKNITSTLAPPVVSPGTSSQPRNSAASVARTALTVGGGHMTKRYFSDTTTKKHSWVCGDINMQNAGGCGKVNNNSSFLCVGCNKGKSGYRKDRFSIYQHTSWTCFCNGRNHYLNYASKKKNPAPYCNNEKCREAVGQFDDEFGFNRGKVGSDDVYLGKFDGERKYKSGGYQRNKQTQKFTGY